MTEKALRARIMGLEEENRELKEQNKHYKQVLEYIQRGIHKAIYTPKKKNKNGIQILKENSKVEKQEG